MSERILTWEELPQSLLCVLEPAQISSRQSRWGAEFEPMLDGAAKPPRLVLTDGEVSQEHLEIILSCMEVSAHSARLIGVLTELIGFAALDALIAQVVNNFKSRIDARRPGIPRPFHLASLVAGPLCARAMIESYRIHRETFDRAFGAKAFAYAMGGITRPELIPILFEGWREMKPSWERNHLKADIETLASKYGLSEEDLQDLAAPACGLSEDGTAVLDYGPRQYRASIDKDLKPFLQDASGKRMPDLPPATPADDQQLVRHAQAKWNWMQPKMKDAIKEQRTRLKKAQQSGRRWKAQSFEDRILKHPLLRYLAARIVWATFEGEKATPFEAGAPIAESAIIGIPHVANLTPDQVQHWRKHQSTSPVKPLFDQWEGAEQPATQQPGSDRELNALPGKQYPAANLLAMLEESGWQRARPDEQQFLRRHTRPFPKQNQTAIVEYPGIPVFFGGEWNEQKLERCYFLSGLFPPQRPSEAGEALELSQVDPVALHAIRADIESWRKFS